MNYDMFDEIDYFTNINDDTMNNLNNQSMNNNNNNMMMNSMNNNNNNQLNSRLLNPYEGFIKGNLFKNLYNAYKNYKPKEIQIKNERDEMLLNVNQLSFARHELNLLLDNYPSNKDALNLFNRYLDMEEKAMQNYERRYGPLLVTSDVQTNTPFAWENDKWPWEM